MSGIDDDHSGQLSASPADDPTSDPADDRAGDLAGDGSGRRAGRAVRSDALANRERLLSAARDALRATDDSDGVSLHAIARAAGVGQGTLYRHFPTRADLLLAVYESDVAGLVEMVPALLAEHPPREALRRWLLELAGYGRVKRGLGQAVEAATSAALSDRWRQPVLGALGDLVGAAQAVGELRGDVDSADVLRLCAFLWAGRPVDDWPLRSEWLIDVLLQGLAVGAAPARR